MKRLYFLLGLFIAFLIFDNQLIVSQDSAHFNSKNVKLTPSDTAKALEKLKNDINFLLNDKNIARSKYGICIADARTGKVIFSKNSNMLLKPASNTKLFTTFSAVKLLGPNFLVKTSVYTDGKIDNGVLNGNVYILGRGDCFLTVNDIEAMAGKIRDLGIQKINGNVYADGTYFDKLINRKDYSGDADEVEPVAPIYPLCINKNEVTVLVKTGRTIGSHVSVQILPNSEYFRVANSAVVAGVVRRKKKAVSVAQGIRIANKFDGTHQIFTIAGSLGPNRTAYYSFTAAKPELMIAGILKDRLQISGISVSGNIGEGKIDLSKKHTLLAESGRSLIDIIRIVNKHSDNFLAEYVFKIIGGSRQNGGVNTASAAKNAIYSVLDSLKINRKGFQLNDGSGLSRRNLVTTEALCHLLQYVKTMPNLNPLESTFSIAACDGTLRRRMAGTYAAKNLHAKTGTHRDVSALSGLTRNRSGEDIAFSMVFNGPGVGYYKMLENKIGILLSEFKY